MKVPTDLGLFQMVDRFAKEQLAEPLNLTAAADIWATCRVDDNDQPIEVLGIAGWRSVIDVFVFRVKPSKHSAKATLSLWKRMNDFFSDKGCRGAEAFIFISNQEKPAQRCPSYLDWLKTAKAKVSERWSIVVR